MVTPPGAYEILNTKLDAVASTLGEVRAKVDDFSAAIVVQARLEERQAQATETLARAFGVIAEHQTQLDALQRALPPLVETRRWVVAGVGIAVSAVLAAKYSRIAARCAARSVCSATTVRARSGTASRTERCSARGKTCTAPTGSVAHASHTSRICCAASALTRGSLIGGLPP